MPILPGSSPAARHTGVASVLMSFSISVSRVADAAPRPSCAPQVIAASPATRTRARSEPPDGAALTGLALHRKRQIPCHSGGPPPGPRFARPEDRLRGEPGTHTHRPLEYGFRARSLWPRPGMTRLSAALSPDR